MDDTTYCDLRLGDIVLSEAQIFEISCDYNCTASIFSILSNNKNLESCYYLQSSLRNRFFTCFLFVSSIFARLNSTILIYNKTGNLFWKNYFIK